MSAEIKTEFQIPDLWYDFYSRLLPGTALVLALRFSPVPGRVLPTLAEFALLAFMGFFVGLLTQPAASRLVGFLESTVELKVMKKDRHYVQGVRAKLGRGSREAMILSKMHGEVAFFTQLFLLGLVYFGLSFIPADGTKLFRYHALIGAFLSLIFAFEVAHRRAVRAKYEDELLVKYPITTAAPVAPAAVDGAGQMTPRVSTTTTTSTTTVTSSAAP